MKVVTHFPREMFQDETSGIANLDARDRERMQDAKESNGENIAVLIFMGAIAVLTAALFVLAGYLIWFFHTNPGSTLTLP